MTEPGQERSGPGVLVTGASGAVGLATATHLAAHGFRVYATARRLTGDSPLERAAAADPRIRVLQMDLTDHVSVRRAVQVAADAGDLYGVVNNAGVYLRGFFEDVSEAEIREVFDANVFGTMAVIREVVPHLRAAGRGRVIIITSVAGRSGSAIASAYCSSKFALEGFGECLSLELRPFGIDTVLIEPAILRSTDWAGTRGDARHARDRESPYAAAYDRASRLMDQVARSSPTTEEDVARAVRAALTFGHPKLRYMVGWRARLVFGLRRYVPGTAVERLFARQVVRRIAGGEPPVRSALAS